ncbi:hypothetical protein Fcan01_25608 [Folsomia candida]|uniref:Uncharacterized protein n=1 Tax=Folsomia candida TaxID=158441 RepID=A0A226D360_FOLCA|nr:hypothetical protein Fcan01_25608 [Folsomia candida]
MLANDINFVKSYLKLGAYFGCLPVKWDTQSRRIVASRRAQRITLLSYIFHSCILACRVFSTITLSSSELLDQGQACLGVVAYLTTIPIRFDVPIDHGNIQLANFLLQQNIGSQKVKFCIKLFCIALAVTGPLISSALGILTIFAPCQPIKQSVLWKLSKWKFALLNPPVLCKLNL